MVVRAGLAATILAACAAAQRPTSAGAKTTAPSYDPQVVDAGGAKFVQNCAFCHGRDATGGESGPNLTRSAVVLADANGDKIGEVVRNGRPGGMPKFVVSDEEVHALAAFLHTAAANSDSEESKRRTITLQDLLTGSAEAGKQFFNGKGHCSGCHSATGDLAGIAGRYQPIALETAMLYPRNPVRTVSITVPGGAKFSGRLEHLDEFTVSLRDIDGWQHSWPLKDVQIKIDDPALAHVKLLPQYRDSEIHNVFAYLETLR